MHFRYFPARCHVRAQSCSGGVGDGAVFVRFVAGLAVEFRADAALSSFGREHPGACGERRVVAHVLTVAALKLGYPVLFVVPVESCNPALQLRPLLSEIEYS
jgi:hypothetical protein